MSHSPGQPFDERFVAYIEDIDLDWRGAVAGLEGLVRASSRLALSKHHRRQTIGVVAATL